MAFFLALGFFQRFVAILVIGAGILKVSVEEEAKQALIQIIVMRDIALGGFGQDVAAQFAVDHAAHFACDGAG